jgi:hypothetical protein
MGTAGACRGGRSGIERSRALDCGVNTPVGAGGNKFLFPRVRCTMDPEWIEKLAIQELSQHQQDVPQCQNIASTPGIAATAGSGLREIVREVPSCRSHGSRLKFLPPNV